jgi:Domain of unknown function (DUF4253)
MTGRYPLLFIVLLIATVACKGEKPAEPKRPEPTVIIKPRHPVLTREQRKDLGFPDDLLAQIELAAGAEAEPFFATVTAHSENMKGETEFETSRLVGFSVRTKYTDDIIATYRGRLRVKGYLLFKSHKGYGNLPDMVTVTRGVNSYDILKIQRTEAPNYQLDTNAIITWLRDRQKDASFVVVGAGPEWVETRFIKAPKNMAVFAGKVVAFSPDVLEHVSGSQEKLVERMKRINGFFLVWD